MNVINMTSEDVLNAIVVMAKAQAVFDDRGSDSNTVWVNWCSLRLAYYPNRNRHRWFSTEGAISKAEALSIAGNLLSRAADVLKVAA